MNAFEQRRVLRQRSPDAAPCRRQWHLPHHYFHRYQDYSKTKWLGFKSASFDSESRENLPFFSKTAAAVPISHIK